MHGPAPYLAADLSLSTFYSPLSYKTMRILFFIASLCGCGLIHAQLQAGDQLLSNSGLPTASAQQTAFDFGWTNFIGQGDADNESVSAVGVAGELPGSGTRT